MLELVNVNDSRAVRNKDNILGLYEMMINQKRPKEAVAKYLNPAYIQHNPLIADGAEGLADWFSRLTTERARARVVVHRIIAVGDYVWAHVNFLNFANDDPKDTGLAVVDIFRMDDDGKAAEHWDILQVVGDQKTNAAPFFAPNLKFALMSIPRVRLRVPAANSNGVI
jgi:predicted SnoaL-like aldol condensation-catalyzing enzyme